MFYLLAVLDLVNEDLRRLEAWNEVFFDHKSCIPRDVSGDLTLPFLIDKTAKAPDINVVAVRHRILHYTEKSFYGCGHISFVYPGLFRDFVYYICFSHFVYF